MPDTAAYLSKNMKEDVLVSLKTGFWIRGKLESFDRHLNLILGDAEELVVDKGERKSIKLGKRVLVRGDMVVAISMPKEVKE